MKNIGVRFLATLFILVFVSIPAFPHKRKKIENKNEYQYVDELQLPLINSGKYYKYTINKTKQFVNFTPKKYSTKNIAFSYQDYTKRTPFQESNKSIYVQSQPALAYNPLMRSATSTNDDPLPGDPGQLPLKDNIWFLLSAVSVYALYKRKSIILT